MAVVEKEIAASKTKPSTCSRCALYENGKMVQVDGRVAVPGVPVTGCHILVVAASPMIWNIGKPLFSGGTEATIKKIYDEENNKHAQKKQLSVRYMYAVRCAAKDFKISIDEINACRVLLYDYICRIKPKQIIALGASAAKAFGFNEGINNLRGNNFVRKISDFTCQVMVTFHPYDVQRRTGLFTVLKNDLLKVYHELQRVETSAAPRIITPTAYEDVIETIRRSRENIEKIKDHDPSNKVVLAVDTETTGLDPTIPEQKLIAASYGIGRKSSDASEELDAYAGVAFPLEHKDAGFTQEQVANIFKEFSALVHHPDVMHIQYNAKFDMKWLALHDRYKQISGFSMDKFPKLDGMLCEHFLDEDKKGNYSLKDLTSDYFPEFGRYEQELKSLLAEVVSGKREEYKKIVEGAAEKRINIGVKRWADFSEDERSKYISDWVRKGYITFAYLDVLKSKYKFSPRTVKTRNTKKSGAVITKAYAERLAKFFKSIPEDELTNCGIFTEADLKEFELPNEKQFTAVTFEEIPLDKLLWYAAMDAALTRKIFEEQRKKINEEHAQVKKMNLRLFKKDGWPKEKLMWPPTVTSALFKFSMPLCRELTEMEFYGIRLDRDMAKKYVEVLANKIIEQKETLTNYVGRKFNPNSGDELSAILFGEYKLTPVKNSPLTGKPSVDAESIKLLSEQHPELEFLNALLTLRKLEKVKGTYLENWLKGTERDGKIRASFNQIGTATHRLSSSKPNLQNIPFYLKEADLNLKKLFVTDDPDKYDFYDLDISNAEMRVLCAYAKDESLINAFLHGRDLHCLTGAGISEYSYEQLVENKENKKSKEYMIRQLGKRLNFLVIYGGGASTLQARIYEDMRVELSLAEAQGYFTKFFEAYPGVSEYMNDTIKLVEEFGVVHTHTGHRRHFPESRYNKKMASRMGRQAVNARIQCTSSILVNYNMIKLAQAIRNKGWDGRLLLTVHDSVAFQLSKDVPKAEVKEVLDEAVVNSVAKEFPWLPVPWAYDCGWGASYGEAKNSL